MVDARQPQGRKGFAKKAAAVGAVPAGLSVCIAPYPALTCRAFTFRPCGA